MKSDLATVRIPCKNLPVMKLGQSSNLQIGEFVIAMGSPFGLSNTITTGVVTSRICSKPQENEDVVIVIGVQPYHIPSNCSQKTIHNVLYMMQPRWQEAVEDL